MRAGRLRDSGNVCYTRDMKKKIRTKNQIKCAALWMAGVLLLTGCARQDGDAHFTGAGAGEQESALSAPQARNYDSVDTAIVIRYDTEEKTISLRNLETGRQYTLAYDGTTVLYDKNGQAVTMGQLKQGELVDVTFVHYNKTLVSLRQSPGAFVYDDQTGYEISGTGRSMTVNGVKYRLADDLAVFSGGELIGLADINSVDALTLRGFDYEIHSICIDRGHGYLRLKNDESFIGGWIEVGSEIIVPITENMLLTVPEGAYNVSVSSGAGRGTLPVTIGRNQEQTLDIGDFAIEVKQGDVYFDVTPANASVYVDGQKVDVSKAVALDYGVHLLTIRADGYETLVKYLSVGQDMASLKMELDKEQKDDDDDRDSDDSDDGRDSDDDDDDRNGNGNSGADGEAGIYGQDDPEVVTASDGTLFYVSVTAPEGAEVYVDGVYVGISPVRFKKVPGSHEVTLRKSGFQTRSYTIELDEEKKDVTYSFSELTGAEEN